MKVKMIAILIPIMLLACVAGNLVAKPWDDGSKTTVFEEEVECAVCGEKVEVSLIGSTNTMGWSDLDMRPAEMQRSTMPMWIQYCPHCGYCAGNVSELVEGAEEIIGTDEYISQLENEEYPDLANMFLCSAMILENAEEYTQAGWKAVYAAWACDDEENENAVTCRLKAVDLFEMAMEYDEDFGDNSYDVCVIVDLLRRAGEFERALETVGEAFDTVVTDDIANAILEFEMELANDEDAGCYTVGDIPNVNELFE